MEMRSLLVLPRQRKTAHDHPRVLRTTADRLVPHERIQAYCQAIAGEFRPEKIILFGSYAYGDPTPDSDVDLLVIMDFHGSDLAKTIKVRSRLDTPFPMDLLVRKPQFIARRLRERDMFIELVMSKGQVMKAGGKITYDSLPGTRRTPAMLAAARADGSKEMKSVASRKQALAASK